MKRPRDDSLDEELEKEARIVAQKKKGTQNKKGQLNKSAINEKIDEITLKLPNGDLLPWLETFTLCTLSPTTEQVKNVHDDFERESVFYKHALAAVNEAQQTFQKLNIPFRRPDDYFAEMVKSDSHMQKIKAKLVSEKERLDEIEKKKKQKDQLKYSKESQKVQKQQQNQNKKKQIDAVTQWRKAREKGNTGDDFSIDIMNEDKFEPKGKQNQNQNQNSKKPQPKKVSKKRIAKNEAYGFGGKKRGMKKNTKESAADTTGFNKYKNKSVDKDLKVNFKKKRPGKQRRMQNKK